MPHCRLILHDEVNCKFEGLDVSMRRKLMSMFSYVLPYAYFLPAYKLTGHLVKDVFFQLGGSTFINLIPEILSVLDKAGWTIELVDNREVFDFAHGLIDENFFSDICWPKGHVCEGQSIVLRDYQLDAVNNFLNNPQGTQVLSTAAGKTLVTAACSKKCEPYGRTIVIVPSKKLVEQTEESYQLVGLDVGVLYGKRKEYDKTHTICTWQSLESLFKKTKKGSAEVSMDEFMDNMVAIIVDEAHGAKADILKKLLSTTFKDTPIRWGLTGTIPKEEHFMRGIFCMIGNLIAEVGARQLIDEGHISECQINIVQLQDAVVYDNYQHELAFLLTDQDRLKYIAKMIKQISKSGNTLVLIPRKNIGFALEELIEEGNFIHGTSKDDIRDGHYDSFRDNDNKVLIATYGIASVGIDLPRIFNMVLIEPGKSFVRVIQSIGRGLRKAEDKDFVQIWDIASSAKYSKRHLTKRKSFYKEADYPFTVEKSNY